MEEYLLAWTFLADLNSHSNNHENRQRERYKAQIELNIIHEYILIIAPP